MKIFNTLLCFALLTFVSSQAAIIEVAPANARMTTMIVGGGAPAGGGGFCASQSWNTLTDFSVDFDHTTDAKTSCYDTADGELGDFAAGTTIATPPTVSPVSGGNAVYCDTDNQYIIFDNGATYFNSTYGELYMSIYLAGNNGNSIDLTRIYGVASEDRLHIVLQNSGSLDIIWEDDNGGIVWFTLFDMDPVNSFGYAYWAQIHVKWDTTRCGDGEGDTCDTDASEEELCARYRADDNADGDYGDGGIEDWQAYTCESSATNLMPWQVEPATDDFEYGLQGTHDVDIYIDDIEISASQPAW